MSAVSTVTWTRAGLPEATARSRMFLALDYLRVRLRPYREAEEKGAGRRADGPGAMKESE